VCVALLLDQDSVRCVGALVFVIGQNEAAEVRLGVFGDSLREKARARWRDNTIAFRFLQSSGSGFYDFSPEVCASRELGIVLSGRFNEVLHVLILHHMGWVDEESPPWSEQLERVRRVGEHGHQGSSGDYRAPAPSPPHPSLRGVHRKKHRRRGGKKRGRAWTEA